MSNLHASVSTRLLLSAILILAVTHTAPLRAEDVIVTGCIDNSFAPCPASCPDRLGTVSLHPSHSTAVPAGTNRSVTMYGVATTASWAVTPTLGTNSGAYRVHVSMGTAQNCAADILVKLAAVSGCTLADTNFVPQAEIYTTAFRPGACLNVWTPVAVITNTSKTPTILFSYASGSYSRWYMDEVRFENLAGVPATAARITEIRPGNPLRISGMGPVSHPFALVSATNPSTPLNQWISEQTNAAGTGTFSFSVIPGASAARFFRVITQ